MQNYKADEVLGVGEGVLVKKEKANRNKNLHTHEFLEIIFISSGEGTEVVDDKSYSVKRGDLLFVNFGESHSFSMSDMEFIHILLRPEFISEVLVNSENIFDVFALPQFSAIQGDFKRNGTVSFQGDELVTASSVIETMLSEYEEKKPGYRTVLHGYIQVLFTMLIRKLKENGKETDRAVEKISQYVEEHLRERITLSDIAYNCFYNPSYFSRKFKSVFGKNLSEYVKERRLEKAAELLASGESSVEEISALTGFSNKTVFYRAFKARYSQTPSEYRKGKKRIL